jgi:UDP-2-acetamido-2-deoxy-ribo-hexuluronate aminotransferase
VLLGAKPVFVDIEEDTANIDASKIEAAITPRTRAIMPVSLYGQPADMDEINAIALRHGLTVIEDAAQSFGATYHGRQSCNLSGIGCTSFFPSKPLGCYGDGGALFANDDELAKAIRQIRVHGQSKRYVHTRIGVGGRMDTLQCAIVLAKMELFDWELQQRQRVASAYDALLLGKGEGVAPVGRRQDRTSVYAQYTVVLEQRDTLQAALQQAGIPTAIHYPVPIHRQPAYASLSSPDACPIAVEMAGRVMSLPMGPYLSTADVQQVTAALLDAADAGRRSNAEAVALPE